jgi:hypothetical protein
MGRKQGVKLPEIPWARDDHKLVWEFINQLEKDANYKVLFGKKDPSEVNHYVRVGFLADIRFQNTSGDSRISVFKRIGEAILPAMHALDSGKVADRLKGQLERYYSLFIILYHPGLKPAVDLPRRIRNTLRDCRKLARVSEMTNSLRTPVTKN